MTLFSEEKRKILRKISGSHNPISLNPSIKFSINSAENIEKKNN